jgi:hypothetical protein
LLVEEGRDPFDCTLRFIKQLRGPWPFWLYPEVYQTVKKNHRKSQSVNSINVLWTYLYVVLSKFSRSEFIALLNSVLFWAQKLTWLQIAFGIFQVSEIMGSPHQVTDSKISVRGLMSPRNRNAKCAPVCCSRDRMRWPPHEDTSVVALASTESYCEDTGSARSDNQLVQRNSVPDGQAPLSFRQGTSSPICWLTSCQPCRCTLNRSRMY